MNPLLQEFVVASLRHLLTVLGVWLITQGWLPFERADIEKYALGFAVLFVSWAWSMWNKYKGRRLFVAAMESQPGTSEEKVREKAATKLPREVMLPLLALSLLVPASQGCAAKRAPVLVAQASLGMAQSVGQLQVAAEQLQRVGALDARTALSVQEKLLAVNARLATVVPVLRAIDRVQQQGVAPALGDIDAAMAMVIGVSQELSTLAQGVPLGESTRAFMDLVRASQQTLALTMVEVARLRAALEK